MEATAVDIGKCQEQDILDLIAYVKANVKTSYAQFKAAMNDSTCATCLFVPDGAKWGPFVEKADGGFLRNNFGGCLAVKGTETCGRAYTQLEECVELACADCTNGEGVESCKRTGAKRACAAAHKAYATECAGSTAVADCNALVTTPQYLFEAAARALCVGP